MIKACRAIALFAALAVTTLPALAAGAATGVEIDPGAAPRVRYGADRLNAALAAVPGARHVVVGSVSGGAIRQLLDDSKLKLQPGEPGREGYVIATLPDGTTAVVGGDDSGAMYGCLDLARRVRASAALPRSLHVSTRPAFVLRGPCIGMQKTNLLPGRKV